MEEKTNRKRLKLTQLFLPLALLTILALVITLRGSAVTRDSISAMQETTNEYISGQEALSQMRETSDYLTNEARTFAVTGNAVNARNYFEEIEVTKRREAALEAMAGYGEDAEVYEKLAGALAESDALAETEIYAMRLSAEGYGIDPASISASLSGVELSAEDTALSAAEKRQKSMDMLFGEEYSVQKDTIIEHITGSMEGLLKETAERQVESYDRARSYSLREHIITVALLVIVALFLVVTAFLVIVPMRRSTGYIIAHEPLPVEGAAEYAYLAEAYNGMIEKTRLHHEELSYEATHDQLTGLFNRKAFEAAREELKDEDTALMIVDVDLFKDINDTFGHEAGDAVLKKVADALRSGFRSDDRVCRIGGDEFAVIMRQIGPELRSVVQSKIELVRDKVAAKDGLPPVTVSIGAAFSDGGADVFKKADLALYAVKEHGRDGYRFYEDRDDDGPNSGNGEDITNGETKEESDADDR